MYKWILALTFILSACSGKNAAHRQADIEEQRINNIADGLDAAAANTQAEASSESDIPTGWNCAVRKDEMRGSTSKTASISAMEELHLAPPYGDTTPELRIRSDPKFGFNILITSEGQPLCRSYSNETLSVKFDNGPVREWSCNGAADGSPGVVFFNREGSLLKAIKDAKRMTVEISYYDNGREQMTFPVAGLKWN